MRQCFFSVLAIAAAVGVYLGTKDTCGTEIAGWLSVFAAAPFAGCGFFRYHQMTLEKFVWVWLKSEILCPKKLVFQSENLYLKCLEETIEIGTRSCRNGTELVERKRSKNRKRKEGGVRLIKTLASYIKTRKREIYDSEVCTARQSRYSGSAGWHLQSGSCFKIVPFTDINYSIASKEDKTEMFLDYSELLNALDSGASAKLTINNRRINKAEFEQSILIPMKEDGLDEYRKEYNEMLLSKISDTNNSILRERYLTISVHKKNIDEARTYFARVGTDITTHLAKLSSIGEELDAGERLKIFRDFFKEDVSATAEFDFKEAVKRGHDFKDWFAPDSMEFLQDHFKIDGRYGRVLYMQDYATYVRDSMVSELCDLSRNLMLSIDILPVPTDEAVREIQNKLLGVETNVTNWQRRQNENNNFSATIPYEMELQRTETKEMLNDLTTRDQRMMFGVLTIVHMADSYKELNSDTETLKSIARKNLCQLSTLRWQQMDGLHTALPFGPRKINALRTLTTESTAVLIPFHTQEIMQEGGIYYGQNAVSKNMIVVDRKKLLNGNSFA